MQKRKVVKKLVRKYGIKHGDLVDINTLKFIAAKENIEINDLMAILGISLNNRSRIRKNAFNKARVRIFDLEDLKEIEVLVKEEMKGIEKVTEKRLERLSNKYKINKCVLNKILRISKNQNYKLKKGQKYIILKCQSEEKNIINQLFVEDIKYRDSIDKEIVEYLKLKYKLSDEEVCELLKAKSLNYKNLMQNKTKKMRIDLIDEYEKRSIEEKLVQTYQMQDYITKNDIVMIKNEINTTNAIIKDTLCISTNAFYRIMNNEMSKTRITIKSTRLKVNYLKEDIKYEYGEGFYTSAEIRKLCKKYKIEFDDFLKNLSSNINRYPYMKQALQNNEQGIYIGEEHRLSEEFIQKNARKIENICKKITSIYCRSSYLYNEKQDISQEAFILILQKGGSIEKNFSYDENLLFNLFASKVKYFVIGKRNNRYKEVLLDNFDQYTEKDDKYDIFEDDYVEPDYSMDSRVKLIHKYVMKIFRENKDYIHYNREKAYKIIAYKLKISIEKLENVIQEIKNIYLEYGFAKKCMDGNIIDMSNSDSFCCN